MVFVLFEPTVSARKREIAVLPPVIRSNVSTEFSTSDRSDPEVGPLFGSEEAVEVERALRTITDRGLQASTLARFAQQHASTDPSRVAQWLLRVSTDFDRAAAFAEVGRLWAEMAPSAAAEFALKLPSDTLRQTMLTAVMNRWLGSDLAGATNWLDQFESNQDLDPVVTTIGRLPALVAWQPEVALSWAESVSNQDERKQSISIVVASWFARDPSSALRYLESTDSLNSFQRETIKEQLGLESDLESGSNN